MIVFRKCLSFFVVLLLLFQSFSNIAYLVKADNVVEDVIVEDVIIENTIVEDSIIEDVILDNQWLKDTRVTDSYIREQMIYDKEEGLYKVIVGDELSISSYEIEYIVGETSKDELLSQLPPEYAWYDIDWPAVIGKFAVGTAIIIVVGVVDAYSTTVAGAPLSIFMGLSPAKVAKEAIVSGIMAAAFNMAIQGMTEKSLDGFSKQAIEGFADGYMWGAIASVTGPLLKRVKLPSRLKFDKAGSGRLQVNGDVVDETGKRIGTAYYDDKYIYLSKGNDFKKFRVFDKSGRELSQLTGHKLKSNTTIMSGQGTKAVLSYTDDLGQIYQKGKKLLPNKTFKLGGFTYKTDKLGRVREVYIDKLKLKQHKGRLNLTDSLSDIGKGFQRRGDERGHLIADVFGGSNHLANLVAQNGQVNKGEYKALELLLKKALESGKVVEKVKIVLPYTDDSFRPDAFRFTYQLDGQTVVKEISNIIN